MAWIQKVGKKHWVYDRVTALSKDGQPVLKRKCFGGFDFKAQAKKLKVELETRKVRGRNNLVDYNATLWEFCDKYLELPVRREPSTTRIIRDAIKRIKSYFDVKVKLTSLSEDSIENFIKWLMNAEVKNEDGRIVKPKYNHTTTHLNMRNFQAVLKLAINRKVIDENPIKGPLKRLGKPKSRVTFLTGEEKERLYASALRIGIRRTGTNQQLYNIIKVFLHTGLRRTELLNLSKEHMPDETRILIPARKMRDIENLGATKSNEPYILELNSAIRPIFHAVESGKIFPGWDKDNIDRRFRRAADDAGLPELTIHGLRHTFASDALARGVRIHEAQRMLNHKSVDTTNAVYGHLEPGRLRACFELLATPTIESPSLKAL